MSPDLAPAAVVRDGAGESFAAALAAPPNGAPHKVDRSATRRTTTPQGLPRCGSSGPLPCEAPWLVLDRDESLARAVLAAMGVPGAKPGVPFVCPLTGGRAVLLWERDPARPARLWLRIGEPGRGTGRFFALARYRLALAAGSFDALSVRQARAGALAAWWSRLAHEAGLTTLAAADWRACKLAARSGLPQDAVGAAHGFDLLVGLRRQAGFPGSWAGTPYAIRFAGPWAGLTEWKARRALEALRAAGVLVLVGHHEATLPNGARVSAPLYGVGGGGVCL